MHPLARQCHMRKTYLLKMRNVFHTSPITKRMASGLREIVRRHKGLYKHVNLCYFIWLTICSLLVATMAQILNWLFCSCNQEPVCH